jgi:Tfp pilus assembly protein PilF
VAVAAGVVVFALACGALVAQAAGRRGAGDTATGEIRESSRQRIDEAADLAAEQKYTEAIDLLDEVIEDAPDNVEAYTMKGWFQYISGDAPQGLVTLIDATEVDDEYPATHAFLAKIFSDVGQLDYARKELEILDSLDPPAALLRQVERLRSELDLPESSSTTTTAAP